MARFKSLMAAAVGAGAIAASIHMHNDKYSVESVWKRQKEKIEIFALPMSTSKERRFEQLKEGLSKVENADPEERCKFEVRFSALVERGTETSVKKYLKTKSYDPYHECTQFERMKDTASEWKGWVGMAGALMLMAGIASFIDSFRKRH